MWEIVLVGMVALGLMAYGYRIPLFLKGIFQQEAGRELPSLSLPDEQEWPARPLFESDDEVGGGYFNPK